MRANLKLMIRERACVIIEKGKVDLPKGRIPSITRGLTNRLKRQANSDGVKDTRGL